MHDKLDAVQQFSMNTLVDLIIENHQTILSKHLIKITKEIQHSIIVISFKSSITEILEQLIQNSCIHGFSSTKEPCIKIAVSETQENICLTYSDNGSGIPFDDYEKVFEPFYTTKRSTDCTGLGLPIIYNHITQKLNGTTSWDKSYKQGVKIVINFPKNVRKVVLSADH